jgi:4-diphosphocytidyl-2-C-methyl-D-erythritol kinase
MLKEIANAKINLALDVVGKRLDGYHDLKMIMMPIELHDVLSFESSKEIELISNVQIENNGVLKAAHLMKSHFNIKDGAKITLEKNIPIGAGLGGGSADIAATLRGLARLWKLDVTMKDLKDLALQLGSDTLFCLFNQTAYVYGRGEHILFVKTPPIKNIYLFTSPINVSTKYVFENHKIKSSKHRFDRLFKLYLNEKYHLFIKKTYNDLTVTTLSLYPELKELEKRIRKLRKPYLMSGSGSTFYISSFEEKKNDFIAKLAQNGSIFIETSPKK